MEDKKTEVPSDLTSQPPSYAPPEYSYTGAAYTSTTYEPGKVVPSGGQPGQTVIFRQPHSHPPPKDYVAFALVVTICCCLPFGIVGIVKAFEARNNYDIGNYAAADSSSASARSWSIAGLVCGIFWMIVVPLVVVIVWVILPTDIY